MTNKYEIPKELMENLNKIKDPESRLLYKITIARKVFKDLNIKKSGKNNFQGFDYFQLEDILPHCSELESKLMLNSKFLLEKKRGVLRVKDCEPIDDKLTGAQTVFYKERPDKKDGGNPNQQMQGIGKVSTYEKRYCYLDYLNIVEPDLIDAEDNSKNSHKTTPKKDTSKKPLPKKQMLMDLDGVKYHMQSVLKDPSDMTEAKNELDKLKMNKKISQDTYNQMSDIIEAQGDKK